MKKKLILITFTLFCALFLCNCKKNKNCDCGNEGFLKYNTETKKYDLHVVYDDSVDTVLLSKGIEKSVLSKNLRTKTGKFIKVRYCFAMINPSNAQQQQQIFKCIEKIE